MNKSNRVYTKVKRAAQKGIMVGVRMQPDQLAYLDKWLTEQPGNLSRPAAIRKIIDEYLKREPNK